MSARIDAAQFSRENSGISLDFTYTCDWCGATETGFNGISIDHWIADGYWEAPALPPGWTWQRDPEADHRVSTNLICNRHEAVQQQNWAAGWAHGKALREEER